MFPLNNFAFFINKPNFYGKSYFQNDEGVMICQNKYSAPGLRIEYIFNWA